MFSEDELESLRRRWDIILTSDEVQEVVEQFKDTAPDDLPDVYEGLTSTDLFNILQVFHGLRIEQDAA